MSINLNKAGPSGMRSENREMFTNKKKDSLGEEFKLPTFESKDAAAKFSFKINEIYMKSIQNGTYKIPSYAMDVHNRRTFSRCHRRRRREKCHPYFIDDFKFSKRDFISVCSRVQDAFESPYRLRTTSLTSGTAGKRPTKILQQSTNCELQRSKSMEDLNGSTVECCQKSKDFDTVYKGIQQLQMQDNI